MPPRIPLQRLTSLPAISSTSQTTFAIRTLSTTCALQSRQPPTPTRIPDEVHPPYPYGPSYHYKQSNRGLYGHAKLRYGNVVAEKYGNHARRKWRPNIHTRRLFSPSLDRFIRVRVSTRVLRTIDKVGGIDEYLLGSKANRIKELGVAGWKLRWRVMQTPAVRERFAAERLKLGLAPHTTILTGDHALGASRDGSTEHLPEVLIGEGATQESLWQETDGMLARDEEFAIGEEAAADQRAEAENSRKVPVDEAGESIEPPLEEQAQEAAVRQDQEEQFMKEEPRPTKGQ